MDAPPPRKAVRRLLLGLGAVAAVSLAYLAWRRMDGAPPGPPPARVRGIVLFCFDTLRQDAFRLPGDPPGEMPVLEALARESSVFVDATAACCWTAPSVTTILTGLRPVDHGVMTFGQATPLVPAVVTLAEMLHAAGWSTSAATGGGWVAPEGGLGQGFDRFSVGFDEKGVGVSLAAWDRERPKDRPFFLFLHTYAAHDPYGHEAFRHHGVSPVRPAATLSHEDLRAGLERGGGTIPEDLIAPFVLQQLTNTGGRLACQKGLGGPRYKAIWHDCMEWLDGGYAIGHDRVALEETLRTAYRTGLPSADDVLRETFEGLRRIGILDDVDLLVVGDHGEAFGEHKSLCHGFNLYDEAIRVPLVLRVRGRALVPRRVTGGCGLIDVTPTILELAGVEPATELPGRSLVALARGGGPGVPIVADMERPNFGALAGATRTQYVSVRTPKAKWIAGYEPLSGRITGEQLFDLATDPGESRSLPGAGPPPESAGVDFCLAVTRERNRIRRVAGLPPLEPACPLKR